MYCGRSTRGGSQQQLSNHDILADLTFGRFPECDTSYNPANNVENRASYELGDDLNWLKLTSGTK